MSINFISVKEALRLLYAFCHFDQWEKSSSNYTSFLFRFDEDFSYRRNDKKQHLVFSVLNKRNYNLKKELMYFFEGFFKVYTFNKSATISATSQYLKYTWDMYMVHLKKNPRHEHLPWFQRGSGRSSLMMKRKRNWKKEETCQLVPQGKLHFEFNTFNFLYI